MICLGFRAWGTPGSGGWVGGVRLVLRAFPELMWRNALNLLEIDPATPARKSNIGTNSLFYKYRLANRARHCPGKI